LLAALMALPVGCAHQKMSFAEAGEVRPVEPDAPPTPPVKVPAPRKRPSQPREGPPIDAVLLRFAAEARQRRSGRFTRDGFPADTADAWGKLVQELDGYLAQPLPQTPLIELVRARITLEAELEYDRRHFGKPPPEVASLVQTRVSRFATRIRAARKLGLGMRGRRAPAMLHWPLDEAAISSHFGMRIHPIDGQRKMHYGLDLVAATGRVVESAAGGIVIQAGWTSGYGLMVEVRHPGDLTTRYSHLSRLLCGPGDAVETGQPLGLVGSTGKSTGPHLHFEVWRGGQAHDPLALLGDRLMAGAAGN
jgi:murein DD-endopeptidase MepM/ murein hydrolase activator NlpD